MIEKVENEDSVIYGLPCVLNIVGVIKNNNTSNKGLSHYFFKKNR